MSIGWMIGSFILVLTPIILVHELGHFVAARFFGIRVEEFGIGFPPRAVTLFKRGGTIYSLNWLPLGGFVRPAGEDDPSIPDGLAAASKRARFFTLAAGSMANFLLAIVLLWITFMIGTPVYDESRVAVGAVREDTPAALVGLTENDILVAANGVEVDSFASLTAAVDANLGQPMELMVLRGGESFTVVITPRQEGEYDQAIEGPLGIAITHPSTGDWRRSGPVESAEQAIGSTYNFLALTVNAPAMLIRGEISPSEARPVSIIGISQIAGRAAESTATTGDWSDVLGVAAAISIALGLTNLLPLPALDGGRILFVILEALRGQRVAPEREGMVHIVGMMLLLGLMLFMMIQDVINPIF